MEKKRYIYSENPYQKMWDTFVYFESEPATKNFLNNIYEKNGFKKEANKFAFQNTFKFIYFIKQAKEYFFSAKQSSILVKPLLIYYGMMSLMKAVILTKDPNYPSNTGVLRHGITSRKLKRSNYQFHDDEIRIQKEGLLPLFYTLMTKNSADKIVGTRYRIKELLSLQPELHESYKRLFNEKYYFPISFLDLSPDSITFNVTQEIMTLYNNPSELLNDLNKYSIQKNSNFQIYEDGINYMKFKWENNLSNSKNNLFDFFKSPMIVRDYKDRFYIRPLLDEKFLLPEIIIDYLLMYNLGMLCRYDTELWGEIIFSFASEDMYIINEFVNTSLRRFPNLILNELFEEVLIFESI